MPERRSAFPVTKFRWRSRGALLYTRQEIVCAAPERVFSVVAGLGGEHGWLFADGLWRLRAAIDRVLGGVGRRARRDADDLRVGDVVDFWRVENLQYPSFIRYKAEMKIPGKAWLQFQFNAVDEGTLLRSEAIFKSSGFFGNVYWYAMYPAHVFLFTGMLRAIAARAEKQSALAASAAQG